MSPRFVACVAVLIFVAGAAPGGFAAEGPEPRREAVHRKADMETGKVAEEPEWKREIRAKLQRKVTFEFVETPLTEAINFLQTLTRVNFIIDRRALEKEDPPITLKVADMPLEMALAWILRLVELDYAIKDRAVCIGVMENIIDDLEIRIYDVRDMVIKVEDYPGLQISPAGQIITPKPEAKAAIFAPAGGVGVGDLAEMIATRVKPDLWAAEFGTAIEARDGRLVVRHTPEVHARIATVLEMTRNSRSPQVRTDVLFCEVTEELLARLRTQEKPGRGVVFLKAPQMKLLAAALRGGEAAKLVETASLTCFSTQRSHVMSGRSFERRGEGGKAQGVYFRGTVLDVRPTVSFDRRYVTMELRLTRAAARGEDLDAAPEFFRIRTTLSCLETDTVMIAGGTVPAEPARRLVALVTPTIVRLEPGTTGKPAGVKSILKPRAAPPVPRKPHAAPPTKRRGAGAGAAPARVRVKVVRPKAPEDEGGHEKKEVF